MYNNQNGMNYGQPLYGNPYGNAYPNPASYASGPYYSAPNQIMQPPQQQFQQPMQNVQQSRPQVKQIMGKWVNKEEDISPADVAMDGNVYLFPFSNADVIVAKRWNANGGIDTQRYILEQQTAQPAPAVTNDDIMNQLQHINERLDGLFASKEPVRKQLPKKETEA